MDRPRDDERAKDEKAPKTRPVDPESREFKKWAEKQKKPKEGDKGATDVPAPEPLAEPREPGAEEPD